MGGYSPTGAIFRRLQYSNILLCNAHASASNGWFVIRHDTANKGYSDLLVNNFWSDNGVCTAQACHVGAVVDSDGDLFLYRNGELLGSKSTLPCPPVMRASLSHRRASS